MSRIFNALVLCVYLILPLEASASDADYVIPVNKNEIKIMHYNVQNLFDAAHDSGKKDYEFIPKDSPEKKNCDKAGKFSQACRDTDWTDKKVELKIQQIKKVIEAQGPLPDILTLVEVENKNVVALLASALGYSEFVMTNSPDSRGIDCAILYSEHKLEPVQYYERIVENAYSLTRNLSAMVFRLDNSLGGGLFAIFPNHWPSQANPTKARLIVANVLRDLVDEIRNNYRKETLTYVISGDFNTIDKDSPNPIDTVILDPKWNAAMSDVHELAISNKEPMLPIMPPGTYYYNSNWNALDRLFVDSTLNDGFGLEVALDSFRIHAPDFLTHESRKGVKIPFRYDHDSENSTTAGYSDHFAVAVKLRFEK
ncbi:MAG: hypothetical protein A2Z20_05305 [Bdellovibrionales bacterium RBG_16_40_8]|nr:MAG: hypothetical protein A2Z20_05305 [Bdellovibrionales bacterium RBG_16_40_8]